MALKTNSWHKIIGIIMATITLGLDQWSKNAILNLLDVLPINITSFFNLVMVWNSGVTFGFLKMDTFWGIISLVVMALVLSVVILVWLLKSNHFIEINAYGMILGGAIGNIIDRVKYGAVVDFLDFHLMGYHWPAFNVADSAIVIGVFLVLILNWSFKVGVFSQNEPNHS